MLFRSASGATGPIAPGQMISVRGTRIGPDSPAALKIDERGSAATELASFRVLVNGIPAPLLYVSANWVNAVVPYEVAGVGTVDVVVESGGQTSAPVKVSVAESNPGIFTADAGRGQGSILNADGSANSTSNPARRGSVVIVFGTGEGRTDPPGVTGKVVSGLLPRPVLPVECVIGGVKAEVRYAGGTEGQVAGLLRVDAVVPLGIGVGAQEIFIKVGDARSQDGVYFVIF